MNLSSELLSKLNIHDENILSEIESYSNSNSELIALISLEFRRTLLGDRKIYSQDNFRMNKLEELLNNNGIPEEEINEIMSYDEDLKCNPKHYCITVGVLMKELYNEIASRCPLFMKAIGNSFGTSLALICLVSKNTFVNLLKTSKNISAILLKYVRDVVNKKTSSMIYRNYTFHAFMYYLCIILTFKQINFAEAVRVLSVINRITGSGEALSVRFISELLLRGLKSESFFNKLNDKSESGIIIQVIMLCTVIDMIETNYEPDEEYENLQKLSLVKPDVKIICTPIKKRLYVVEKRIEPDVYRIHRVSTADVYDMRRLKDQFVQKICYSLNEVKSYIEKKDMSAEELEEMKNEQKEVLRSIKHEMYRERSNVFTRCFFMSCVIIMIAVMVYAIMQRGSKNHVEKVSVVNVNAPEVVEEVYV